MKFAKGFWHFALIRAKTGSLLGTILLFLVSCGPPLPDGFSGYSSSPYGTSSYSQKGVEYFWEIGLCFEGNICDSPRVIKWAKAIRIHLAGQYTPADERELDNIIFELSQLTGLSITKTNSIGDINIYIVPQSQFVSYCTAYDPSNRQEGHFEVRDQNNVINQAKICIENTTNEQLKHHLLREELTQSLGLGSDSYRYTNSIFQQDPQYQPTQYADIDKELIKLLYDKRIRPGMTREEIDQILKTPTSPTQVALMVGRYSNPNQTGFEKGATFSDSSSYREDLKLENSDKISIISPTRG